MEQVSVADTATSALNCSTQSLEPVDFEESIIKETSGYHSAADTIRRSSDVNESDASAAYVAFTGNSADDNLDEEQGTDRDAATSPCPVYAVDDQVQQSFDEDLKDFAEQFLSVQVKTSAKYHEIAEDIVSPPAAAERRKRMSIVQYSPES